MLHPEPDHLLGLDRARPKVGRAFWTREVRVKLISSSTIPRCEDADLDQRAVLCLNTSTHLQYTGSALLTVVFAQLMEGL